MKKQILYNSTYMTYLEHSNSSRQKVDWWLPKTGRKENVEFEFNRYKIAVYKVEKIV